MNLTKRHNILAGYGSVQYRCSCYEVFLKKETTRVGNIFSAQLSVRCYVFLLSNYEGLFERGGGSVSHHIRFDYLLLVLYKSSLFSSHDVRVHER